MTTVPPRVPADAHAALGPPDSGVRDEQLELSIAHALRFWDALDLELGDTVLVTAGAPHAVLYAIVASWYGAEPVLVVSPSHLELPAPLEVIAATDAAQTISSLKSRIASRPGIVAAELSGRAEFVDLILEVVPPFARVAFAGMHRELLTVDFYANVHRKGLKLASLVLDDPHSPTTSVEAALVARAGRLLRQQGRVGACRSALALTQAPD